jgi:hypothetical protein
MTSHHSLHVYTVLQSIHLVSPLTIMQRGVRVSSTLSEERCTTQVRVHVQRFLEKLLSFLWKEAGHIATSRYCRYGHLTRQYLVVAVAQPVSDVSSRSFCSVGSSTPMQAVTIL